MQSWTEEEFATLDLGDARRNVRCAKIVGQLAARPASSIPRAFAHDSQAQATYRFLGSERVKPEAIQTAHFEATARRLQHHAAVLVIQDTTDADFTHLDSDEMGVLDHAKHHGFKIHNSLAATLDGVPLGLVDQQIWTRPVGVVGVAHEKRRKATKDKESQRWLDAQAATEARVPADTSILTVADAEADMYDFVAAPRRDNSFVLVRACQDRRVCEEGHRLFQEVERQPVAGRTVVRVTRADGRAPREAHLEVRFTPVTLRAPHERHDAPVRLMAVLATEPNAPNGVKPLRWLLLTTLPVAGLDAAVHCTALYAKRWLVEYYHFTLKSGCQIEKLQLEKASRLKTALACYSVVAWRVLFLTLEARRRPDASCEEVLAPSEWKALYCIVHKTSRPPKKPPRLGEAARWIAKMGGFMGSSKTVPGVKTTWHGLFELQRLAELHDLLAANHRATRD